MEAPEVPLSTYFVIFPKAAWSLDISSPTICPRVGTTERQPPFPQPPELSNTVTPIRGKLKLIQAYITSLE